MTHIVNQATHDSHMRCWKRCLASLREAAAHRRAINGLGWIEYERECITIEANYYALTHGLTTVTMADVERVEGMAVGHVDYAEKLALYVSELVHGVREVRP